MSSLIFLKRRPKKQMKSFSFFFLLFSLLQEVFVSFPQTERVKINHRKKNRDSKKKKKKTKTKTILIRYNNKNESDGVIGVEMARAKYGPDMFRQSGRRGRIRLFPTSLGAGDAHVYIENDSRENATRTETIGRTGSIFSARD